jgi:hypothetical protein
MAKLKDKLIATVDAMVKLVKPRDRTNTGPYLFEIWIWQELCALAEDRVAVAWKKAQDNGIIPQDDDMRKKSGETIVTESDKFSCVATVASPGERFDKDQFIAEIVRKYKLRSADLYEIADSHVCKKEAKAALKKRVLEA